MVLWLFAYFFVGCCWAAQDYAKEGDWDPDADMYERAWVAAKVVFWPVRLLKDLCWNGTLIMLWCCNFFEKQRVSDDY